MKMSGDAHVKIFRQLEKKEESPAYHLLLAIDPSKATPHRPSFGGSPTCLISHLFFRHILPHFDAISLLSRICFLLFPKLLIRPSPIQKPMHNPTASYSRDTSPEKICEYEVDHFNSSHSTDGRGGEGAATDNTRLRNIAFSYLSNNSNDASANKGRK